MDIIQKLNEYFESDKFKNWFNNTVERLGYVSMNDVIKHAEQDGVLAPGVLYGSALHGWAYPCTKSGEES